MSRPYCSLLFPRSRVSKSSGRSQSIENKEQDERSGEPRRTRTSNPLIKSREFVVHDVRNVLPMQQIAMRSRNRLRPTVMGE